MFWFFIYFYMKFIINVLGTMFTSEWVGEFLLLMW